MNNMMKDDDKVIDEHVGRQHIRLKNKPESYDLDGTDSNPDTDKNIKCNKSHSRE